MTHADSSAGTGGAANGTGGAAGAGQDAAVVSPPANVTLMPGDARITVYWSPMAGADSYNVYFASHQGVTTSNYASLADGTRRTGATSPLTERVLDPEKTYYFRVTAVIGGVESSESMEAYAIPALAARFVAMLRRGRGHVAAEASLRGAEHGLGACCSVQKHR